MGKVQPEGQNRTHVKPSNESSPLTQQSNYIWTKLSFFPVCIYPIRQEKHVRIFTTQNKLFEYSGFFQAELCDAGKSILCGNKYQSLTSK